MKIITVLTVAVAAALIPCAAFAEKSQPAATKVSVPQKKVEKKDDGCPFLFGCSDGWKAENAAKEKPKTKSAEAQPKKDKKAVRHKRASVKVDKTVTGSIAKTPVVAVKAAVLTTDGGGRPYAAIVAKYAAQYGVPVSMAHAVIKIESGYRVDARGSAGEIGLMQIKPATARMMGYSGSASGLFDPDTNIKYGLKYLSMAHDLGGGDTCGTILRYNAGHAATRMNKRSSSYCAQVKVHMAGA